MDFSSRFLIYVTGPIGVGKSTFLPILFQLLPIRNVELISTDLFYYLYFRSESSPVGVNYSRAKDYCRYKIERKLANNESFVWETVFAKADKFNTLNMCIERNYNIMGVFLGTDDESLLIDRTNMRKEQGWYGIPTNKVIDRYRATMDNLLTLFSLSPTFIAIDTSSSQYEVVLVKLGNKVNYFSNSCRWLKSLRVNS